MKFQNTIQSLPGYAKMFVFAFVLTLSFGYYTGVFFIRHTTDFTTEGIYENYNGNEAIKSIDDNWEEDNWEETEASDPVKPLKFKRSEQEIISTVHTHVVSFSLIFLALGGILLLTSIPVWFKKILIIEPFVSILLTFGGIWLMWKGISWMKYIVMISGVLMTLVFTVSVVVILLQLLRKNQEID